MNSSKRLTPKTFSIRPEIDLGFGSWQHMSDTSFINNGDFIYCFENKYKIVKIEDNGMSAVALLVLSGGKLSKDKKLFLSDAVVRIPSRDYEELKG